MIAPLPSVVLQARENGAVGGDADEEERSGRGGVDGGAVVVLQEAELDGGRLCALDGVGGSVRRPRCARRAHQALPRIARSARVAYMASLGVVASLS